LAEGFGLLAVKSKAERPLSHETEDPSTGVGVDAEVCEGRDHRSGVEVVKEAGNIKEQYAPDVPAPNGHLRFEAEERCGVRRGMVFPRAELGRWDEVVVAFVCA
jgi:hypothetical protein